MTTEERADALVAYRLEQATESMAEAQLLKEGGYSLRSVVNRLYYAMFYAVLALLVKEPFSSSKHSGVVSYFNREFVQRKRFRPQLGRALNKAFDWRMRGDYREFAELPAEEIEALFPLASEFVKRARELLVGGRETDSIADVPLEPSDSR